MSVYVIIGGIGLIQLEGLMLSEFLLIEMLYGVLFVLFQCGCYVGCEVLFLVCYGYLYCFLLY